MTAPHSALAVFLWTLRRKWKGFAAYVAATGALILAILHIYPEIEQLQGKAIAEALGGDIEVSLTQDGKAGGDYTLTWGAYDGADGYVVVESDTEFPLGLTKDLGDAGVDLRMAATLLPNVGRISLHPFDAAKTEARFVDLDQKYGEENALVYFGVLAFRGELSDAGIKATSQTVNTRKLVAQGAFDTLLDHPLVKIFTGDGAVDVYSVKGFLCLELFNGLTIYLIIYFLIQYAGAFCSEIEAKTIDVILSTPLTRRGLFVGRYVAWVALDVLFIVSWILFIYLGVLSIGHQAEAPVGDVARTMLFFLPFLLSVQGVCMLASVATNHSMKAYAVSFGLYFGMGILDLLGTLSERFSFVKYASLTYYLDYDIIFIEGVVPWRNVAVLCLVAIVLFFAGLWVFERKDLAS